MTDEWISSSMRDFRISARPSPCCTHAHSLIIAQFFNIGLFYKLSFQTLGDSWQAQLYLGILLPLYIVFCLFVLDCCFCCCCCLVVCLLIIISQRQSLGERSHYRERCVPSQMRAAAEHSCANALTEILLWYQKYPLAKLWHPPCPHTKQYNPLIWKIWGGQILAVLIDKKEVHCLPLKTFNAISIVPKNKNFLWYQ